MQSEGVNNLFNKSSWLSALASQEKSLCSSSKWVAIIYVQIYQNSSHFQAIAELRFSTSVSWTDALDFCR